MSKQKTPPQDAGNSAEPTLETSPASAPDAPAVPPTTPDAPAVTPAKPPTPRFEIRTPHAGFTGLRGKVHFNSGVGHTGDAREAAFLKGLGYAVKDTQPDGKPLPPAGDVFRSVASPVKRPDLYEDTK